MQDKIHQRRGLKIAEWLHAESQMTMMLLADHEVQSETIEHGVLSCGTIPDGFHNHTINLMVQRAEQTVTN